MYRSIEPWGIIKYFKTGNFRFAIYSYNDEPDIIYLANVKTRLLSRNKGFGNAILEYVDSLNKTIYLQTNNKTRKWYKRHGYEDYENNWMRKSRSVNSDRLYLSCIALFLFRR